MVCPKAGRFQLNWLIGFIFLTSGIAFGKTIADVEIKLSEKDFQTCFGDKFFETLSDAKLEYDEKEQSISIAGACGFCSVMGLKKGDVFLSVNGAKFPSREVPIFAPGDSLAGGVYLFAALSEFIKGHDDNVILRIKRSKNFFTMLVSREFDPRKKLACKPEDTNIEIVKKKILESGACSGSTCKEVTQTASTSTAIEFSIKGASEGFSELTKIIENLNKIPGFRNVRDVDSKFPKPPSKLVAFIITGKYSCTFIR